MDRLFYGSTDVPRFALGSTPLHRTAEA